MNKIIVIIVSLLFIISCSTDSSDLSREIDSDIIIGEVVDSNDELLQNVDILVLYIAENADDLNSSESLSHYPNPFNGMIAIEVENEVVGFEYVLKAKTLDRETEIQIVNQTLSEGKFQFIWAPEENVESGIYILEDNLNNEAIVFYAPYLEDAPSFSRNIKPRSPISVGGSISGKLVTRTDLDGEFSFDKSDLIQTDESIVISRKSSDNVELEKFIVSDNINIVAYVNDEYYSFKEVDYKNGDLIDLKLRMP